MKTKTLQVLLALLGTIVLTRFAVPGVLLGGKWVSDGAEVPVLVDSEVRFLSALSGGVAFLFLWLIKNFKEQRFLFLTLMTTTLLGGLSRVLSIVLVGMPPFKAIVPMFVEFGFPIICLPLYYSILRDSQPAEQG